MVEAGRSERHRLKAGEGKTVSALTRMLVTVSGWVRCGLNWYLGEGEVGNIMVSLGTF
jgi:hypothetical protein